MLFKLRMSAGLGLFACLLTVLVCWVHDTTLKTTMFRAGITLLVFAGVGFFLSGKVVAFYEKLRAEVNPRGNNLDIVSEADPDIQAAADESETTEPEAEEIFAPLDATELPHVTSPNE